MNGRSKYSAVTQAACFCQKPAADSQLCDSMPNTGGQD